MMALRISPGRAASSGAAAGARQRFKHRPISERHDVLVGDDPFSRAIVAAAPGAALARPLPLRAAAHRSGRTRPQGLRWYLMIALAVGLVLARGDTGARLISAFDSGAGAAATMDAWIDPPPYTGMPLTVSGRRRQRDHGAAGLGAEPARSRRAAPPRPDGGPQCRAALYRRGRRIFQQCRSFPATRGCACRWAAVPSANGTSAPCPTCRR